MGAREPPTPFQSQIVFTINGINGYRVSLVPNLLLTIFDACFGDLGSERAQGFKIEGRTHCAS
jgi:hypothetical protein